MKAVVYYRLCETSFSIILNSHAVDGDGTVTQKDVQEEKPETNPISMSSTMPVTNTR